MAPSIWKDIKKTVKDGVTVAAEKTEEYTKIGKLKVEIININRNLDKVYAVLGREVYGLLTKRGQVDIVKSVQVKSQMKKIDDLKTKLKAKEKEIKSIKEEASAMSNKPTEAKKESSNVPKSAKKTSTPKRAKKTTSTKRTRK